MSHKQSFLLWQCRDILFLANTCTAGFKEILCHVLYQEMILTCSSEEKEERTVRDGPLEKLWGVGGQFWSLRNFFLLSNSLDEFFLGHSMNIVEH